MKSSRGMIRHWFHHLHMCLKKLPTPCLMLHILSHLRRLLHNHLFSKANALALLKSSRRMGRHWIHHLHMSLKKLPKHCLVLEILSNLHRLFHNPLAINAHTLAMKRPASNNLCSANIATTASTTPPAGGIC